MTDAVVIGGGPAGLMAAERLAANGLRVMIADAMPSIGRKFLMAGKSGLNLTKNEPRAAYLRAFGDQPQHIRDCFGAFGPQEVMAWAEGLDQVLFTGSTGRVFPKAMKASPLLRAWLSQLAAQDVQLRTRWRWKGWQGDALCFDTPEGDVQLRPKVTVLALGGASWARLGSDGAWSAHFPKDVAPFTPANCGLRVPWSAHMARFFGQPVKSVALQAGQRHSRGECVVTESGLEGGGIYPLTPALRNGAPLTIDLLPDWSQDRIAQALQKPRGKASWSNHLRKVLRLDPVRLALLAEFGRPYSAGIAAATKRLPIGHEGLQPLDQAISTAGGLRFDALTEDLMMKTRPGVFCVGEMLDWEAPTGGYLISGCLALGRMGGDAAARYAAERP